MKKMMIIALGALTLVSPFNFSTLNADNSDMRAKLVVKGSASLFKPADQLKMTIGVVTEADLAEEAMKANNQKMNKIVDALEKAGLSKDDYQTGRFVIQPIWSHPPINPLNSDKNYKSIITGYSVSNSVNIKTDKMNLGAEIIDQATKAGANNVDNLSFGLKNDRIYKTEVINQAAANAMADAKTLASATGQKLIRLLNSNLDDAAVEVSSPRTMAFYAKGGQNSDSMPINAGDVEVNSTVSLVYEIAPQ